MRLGMFVVASAALALCACGAAESNEYTESIPDMDAVGMELTGADSEGLNDAQSTSSGLAPSDVAFVQSAVSDVPEFLKDIRAGIHELNQGVKLVLAPVLEAISESGGREESGSVRTWTKDRGAVTFKLTIVKLGGSKFGWRVDAKPLGGDDSAYVVVMGGRIQKKTDARRGKGVLGVNLDNLKTVDSTFLGQGQLLCAFHREKENKKLAYLLKEFTVDASKHPPVSAAFVGHKVPSGQAKIRMAGFFDLENVKNGTDAKELLRLRAHWIPGKGGHARMLATGGDIPSGEYYVGGACWNTSEQEQYKVLIRFYECNPSFSSCAMEVIDERGNRDACDLSFNSGEDFKPADSILDTSDESDGPSDALDSLPSDVEDSARDR
jgi:hypothetical protein